MYVYIYIYTPATALRWKPLHELPSQINTFLNTLPKTKLIKFIPQKCIQGGGVSPQKHS